jgi:hypothetical protein
MKSVLLGDEEGGEEMKEKKKNQSTILRAIVSLRCTIAARRGRKTSLGCRF